MPHPRAFIPGRLLELTTCQIANKMPSWVGMVGLGTDRAIRWLICILNYVVFVLTLMAFTCFPWIQSQEQLQNSRPTYLYACSACGHASERDAIDFLDHGTFCSMLIVWIIVACSSVKYLWAHAPDGRLWMCKWSSQANYAAHFHFGSAAIQSGSRTLSQLDRSVMMWYSQVTTVK